MTKEQIELLKKYCQITKQEKYFGFVRKDKAGKYSVETMTGDIITDLAYEGTYAGYDHLVGKLVTISYGTCGGACELGKPDENCIKNKAYSKNKCAVILVEKLDVAEHVISLTFENLLKITENK